MGEDGGICTGKLSNSWLQCDNLFCFFVDWTQ